MIMSRPIETIYQHVKNQIISKSVFPGTRIIEEDLTKETGISRTSIRAALANLQYDGFVDIFPNRGTFVVKPTYDDIKSVYHVRRYLEAGALNLAIGNFDEKSIARMEQSLADQRKLMANFSISEYAKLNREFHEEIVLASKNDYYEKYLHELYNKCQIYMIFYDYSRDNTGSLLTHKKLLDAIKANNVDGAVRAVQEDVDIGIHDINMF